MSRVRSQVRRALDAKQRAGQLPPQACPSCQADLADPGVPAEYREYARMFTLAYEVEVAGGGLAWRCRYCQHMWGRHDKAGS